MLHNLTVIGGCRPLIRCLPFLDNHLLTNCFKTADRFDSILSYRVYEFKHISRTTMVQVVRENITTCTSITSFTTSVITQNINFIHSLTAYVAATYNIHD